MEYDYVEEVLRRSELTLERLLLNVKGSAMVKQRETGLTRAGDYDSLAEEIPEWMSMLVWDISVKEGRILIEVSGEK